MATKAAEFLAIGRLRRDLILVAEGSKEDVTTQAEQAVRQGRAAQVWIVPIAASMSEAEIAWAGTDSPQASDLNPIRESVPALNPGNGPQEDLSDSDAKLTSPREQIRLAAEETRTESTGGATNPASGASAAQRERDAGGTTKTKD